MSQNISGIMNKIDTEPLQKFNIENGTETLERAGSADVMKVQHIVVNSLAPHISYVISKNTLKCFFLLCVQIFVATNPRGAEPLPPGIVVSESDLFLRRLWGEPSEVLVHDYLPM